MPAEPQLTNYITLNGKMSTFGGPQDHGVAPDENLALVGRITQLQLLPTNIREMFLTVQPLGTTGSARRLDTSKFYIACRWDYKKTPKKYLLKTLVTVKNPNNGKTFLAQPIDWGPAESTGRIADMSPALAACLDLYTDEICQVMIPLPQKN